MLANKRSSFVRTLVCLAFACAAVTLLDNHRRVFSGAAYDGSMRDPNPSPPPSALIKFAATAVLTRGASRGVSRGGGVDVQLRARFAPLITPAEKALAVRNLLELAALLENASVQYFLYSGTLIGSYRHHGMVPWDDDVDVMVNGSQRALLEKVLSGRPGYGLETAYPYMYKWYGHDGTAAGDRTFKWPYVDIFFFTENDTHISDSEIEYSKDSVYAKRDVFPLVRRPFEGGRLLAPRNASAVLAVTYNVSECRTAEYLHKQELNVPGERRFTTDCANLHSLYPFAFCAKMAKGACVVERLKIGDSIIGEYLAVAPAVYSAVT